MRARFQVSALLLTLAAATSLNAETKPKKHHARRARTLAEAAPARNCTGVFRILGICASPLVVQLPAEGQQAKPITLTAPDKGVNFDLFGHKASADALKPRISWFAPGTADGNFLLALPDARGEIRGIDQLFGNNTTGPDGAFADNGFVALAKWDANADGVIDARDPVFAHLRLWQDSNTNGRADAGEIYALEDLRVKEIHLTNLDTTERADVHGNVFGPASSIITQDGREHMIVDLWLQVAPSGPGRLTQ